MRIPENTVNKIYAAIDIVGVVMDYVPSLKKKGNNWTALSPFQKEKTPSFFVNGSKNIFKCFSSGKGGNAVTFIIEMEGCDYREALTILANKYGIEMAEEEAVENPIISINRRFMSFCQKTIARRQEALDFMKNRDISKTTYELFNVGYSDKDPSKIGDLSVKELLSANIHVQTHDKMYYKYNDRIIFPFLDRIGRPVGFMGRALNTSGPKYMNTSGSPVFDKSKVVYGLVQAKRHIRSLGYVILVEGQMDVLGLHTAGVCNAVAGSGTGFSSKQALSLTNYTDHVVIMYDGDSAGQRAMIKSLDTLIEAGFLPDIIVLPDGEDPDSIRRKEDIRIVIEGKMYFLDYYLGLWRRCMPKLKPAASAKLFDSISKISDPVRLQESVEYVSKEMSVPLMAIMDKVMEKKEWKGNTLKVSMPMKLLPEYHLLHVLVHNPDKKDQVKQWINIPDLSFDKVVLDDMRKILFDGGRQSRLSEGISAQIYADMCMSEVGFDDDAVKDLCDQVRRQELDRRIDACGDEIIKHSGDEEKQAEWYVKKEMLIRDKYQL